MMLGCTWHDSVLIVFQLEWFNGAMITHPSSPTASALICPKRVGVFVCALRGRHHKPLLLTSNFTQATCSTDPATGNCKDPCNTCSTATDTCVDIFNLAQPCPLTDSTKGHCVAAGTSGVLHTCQVRLRAGALTMLGSTQDVQGTPRH